jgi:hypothetical protein
MLETIAAEQGWNTDSQLTIVLRFIEQRGLESDLAAFAQAQQLEEQQLEKGNTPLNLEAALDELEHDDDYSFYIAEIGLFHSDDPHTAFDSYEVAVASDSGKHAMNEAVDIAKNIIPTTFGVTFQPMTEEAEKADPLDYDA